MDIWSRISPINPVSRWSNLANMDFFAEIIWRTIEIQPYQVMLLQDTIGEHLLEVDKAAREREEMILKQLEEKEPLPDKEKDQMAWVRVANQHRAIAEEIILKELIYV